MALLHYKKLSDEEDKMRHVLSKGDYPFYVSTVELKKTKGGLDKDGNQKPLYDMLEVELMVSDPLGRERKVKDWIVFMDEMNWKFKHFAVTCDLGNKYDDDSIEDKDFLGKHGVVKLGVRDYQGQDGEMRMVNNVVDYVKPGEAKPLDTFQDDDIPL